MIRLLGGLSAVVVALLVSPPSVLATSVTSASMYSEPGEWVGQGRQRVFHAGNSTALFGFRRDGVVIASAHGGPYDEAYSFQFRGPDGRLATPGVYVDVERLPFEDPGHPALDIEGEHRGCNKVGGQFQVLELDLDAARRLSRLWVVFHEYCEGSSEDVAWGEIRINAWVPETQSRMAPGIVRWPPQDAWDSALAVPVTYRGAVRVTATRIAGANPGDFSVVTDGCTGRTGPCDVAVRFVPTGPGLRTALLRLRDARGRVHETVLEGFRHGGETRADFEVLPGDVAAVPGAYHYDAANARFSGQVTEQSAALFLAGTDNNSWELDVSNLPALRPGTYADAESTHANAPYLNVFRTPLGCIPNGGEFTVYELAALPDGRMRAADIGFVQECYADRRPALVGRWRYRAGAREQLPSWLVPGARPGVEAPPRRVAPRSCDRRIPATAKFLHGSSLDDRFVGTSEADLLFAGNGEDRIDGLRGRDCIVGGRGSDRLRGGRGGDVLVGGPGRDLLIGGPGRDVMACGPGHRDVARAQAGDRTRGCERIRRG